MSINIDLTSFSGNYVYPGNLSSNLYELSGTTPPECTSVTFYMNASANAELYSSSAIFNCPVTFDTRASSSHSDSGIEKTLTFTGNVTFNEHTTFHTHGSLSGTQSIIYFGSDGTNGATGGSIGNARSFTGYFTNTSATTDNNNGFDIVKIAGMGYYIVRNPDTLLQVALNPITAGINQYSPTGHFTATPGSIRAIIGDQMVDETVIAFTTYMNMDPIYDVEFDANIDAEIFGIDGPKIGTVYINNDNVKFDSSPFYDLTVNYMSGTAKLFLNGCHLYSYQDSPVFTVTGTNAGTLILADSYLSSDQCVLYPTSSAAGMFNLNSLSTSIFLSDDVNVDVSTIDFDFTSHTEPAITQQFYYVLGNHTYDFGNVWSTSSYPLNIIANNNVTLSNAMTLRSGLNIDITETKTVTVTNATIYAGSNNNNLALNISGDGTFTFGGDASSLNIGRQQMFFSGLTALGGTYALNLVGDGCWYFDTDANYYSSSDPNSHNLNRTQGAYTTGDLDIIQSNGMALTGGNNKTYKIYSNYYNADTPVPFKFSTTYYGLCIGGTNGEYVATQSQYNFSTNAVTLASTYYDCDSSIFVAPFDLGTSSAVTAGSSSHPVVNISNTGTSPYIPSNDNYLLSSSNLYIYLTQNYNISQAYDLTPANNANANKTWYGPSVYLVSSSDGSNTNYLISGVDNVSRGVTIYLLNLLTASSLTNGPIVNITSTSSISLDITGSPITLLGTLSNENTLSGANYAIIMSGSGTNDITFGVTTFNVHCAGSVSTCTNTISGNSNVTVNYYTGIYDFSTGNRSLEYTNGTAGGGVYGGINLASATNSTYSFIGTLQRISVIISGGKVQQLQGYSTSSYDHGLSAYLYGESNGLDIEGLTLNMSGVGDNLQLYGNGYAGTYTFTNSVTNINVNDNIDGALIQFGANDMSDIFNVTFDNAYTGVVTINNPDSAYLYDIKSYTTDTSVIDTYDTTFGGTHTYVFWPGLSNIAGTNIAPYISTNNYVAYSFDPVSGIYVYHKCSGYFKDASSGGASMNTFKFVMANGNTSNSATSVTGTLSFSSFAMSSTFSTDNTLYNSLTNLTYFNSDPIFCCQDPVNSHYKFYYGYLSNNSVDYTTTDNKTYTVTGLDDTHRVASFSVSLPRSQNVYLGFPVVKLALTSYSTFFDGMTAAPIPYYNMFEDDSVEFPSLLSPGDLNVNSANGSYADMYFEFDDHNAQSFGVPVYIMPRASSGADLLGYYNGSYYSRSDYLSHEIYIAPGVAYGNLHINMTTDEYYQYGYDVTFELTLLSNVDDGDDSTSDNQFRNYMTVSSNIYNTAIEYLFPLISLDQSTFPMQGTDTINGTPSGTLTVGDDDSLAVYTKGIDYNDSSTSFVTYTIILYINSPIVTGDGSDFNYTITALDSVGGDVDTAYTYTFDNNGSTDYNSFTPNNPTPGCATFTYDGTDNEGFYPVRITIKSQQMMSLYTFNQQISSYFRIYNSTSLAAAIGDPLDSQPLYVTANWILPPTLYIGYGSPSFTDMRSVGNSFSPIAGNFDKGVEQSITLMSLGSVPTGYTLNVSFTITPSLITTVSLMDYTYKSNSYDDEEIFLDAQIIHNQYTGTVNYTPNQNNLISGDGAYYMITFDPTYSLVNDDTSNATTGHFITPGTNGNNTDNFDVMNIYDNSITHELLLKIHDLGNNTYSTPPLSSGAGCEFTVTSSGGTSRAQQPTGYSTSQIIDVQDIVAGICINPQTSSIPYTLASTTVTFQPLYVYITVTASNSIDFDISAIPINLNGTGDALVFEKDDSPQSYMTIDNTNWNDHTNRYKLSLGTNTQYLYYMISFNINTNTTSDPIDSTNDYAKLQDIATAYHECIDFVSTYPFISTDNGSTYTSTKSGTLVLRGVSSVYHSGGLGGDSSDYYGQYIEFIGNMLIKMPLNAYGSGDHKLSFTSTTDGYVISGIDTVGDITGSVDNGYYVQYSGTDSDAHYVQIHFTTSNLMDTYLFNQVVPINLSIQELNPIVDLHANSIQPYMSFVQTDNEFRIPPMVLIGVYENQALELRYGTDFTNMASSGTDAIYFDSSSGHNMVVTLATVGQLSGDQTITGTFSFDPSLLQPSTSGLDGSNNITLTGQIDSENGHYFAYNTFSVNIPRDGNMFLGDTFSITMNESLSTSEDLTIYSIMQYPSVVFYRNGGTNYGQPHKLTFYYGAGIEINPDNQLITTSDSNNAVPNNMSAVTAVDIYPLSRNLAVNISAALNSSPYSSNTLLQENLTVTYNVVGTTATDLADLTHDVDLVVGRDIFFYQNNDFSDSGLNNAVILNSSNYNLETNTVYIVLSPGVTTQYNYLKISFTVQTQDSYSDYQYLADEGTTLFAVANYNNTDGGQVPSQSYLDIGDWRILSDAVGNLVFQFIGTTVSDINTDTNVPVTYPNALFKLPPQRPANTSFLMNDDYILVDASVDTKSVDITESNLTYGLQGPLQICLTLPPSYSVNIGFTTKVVVAKNARNSDSTRTIIVNPDSADFIYGYIDCVSSGSIISQALVTSEGFSSQVILNNKVHISDYIELRLISAGVWMVTGREYDGDDNSITFNTVNYTELNATDESVSETFTTSDQSGLYTLTGPNPITINLPDSSGDGIIGAVYIFHVSSLLNDCVINTVGSDTMTGTLRLPITQYSKNGVFTQQQSVDFMSYADAGDYFVAKCTSLGVWSINAFKDIIISKQIVYDTSISGGIIQAYADLGAESGISHQNIDYVFKSASNYYSPHYIQLYTPNSIENVIPVGYTMMVSIDQILDTSFIYANNSSFDTTYGTIYYQNGNHNNTTSNTAIDITTEAQTGDFVLCTFTGISIGSSGYKWFISGFTRADNAIMFD